VIPGTTTSSVTVLRSSPIDLTARVQNGTRLVTTEPFDPAWQADGISAQPQLGVTTSVPVSAQATPLELRYSRWPIVRAGYLASALAVGLSLIAALVIRRRRDGGRVDVRTAS
jgi:hypothetical protein